MKIDKNEVKQKIIDYEYVPFKQLSGVDVVVKNLQCNKTYAIADVEIHYLEENRKEIYRKCQYDYKHL